MIALLNGDFQTALDQADAALKTGDESGYFRGWVGAMINRAHVMHALGRLEEAREFAEKAVGASAEHHQLKVAALDCLANVFIALQDLAAAESTFERIGQLRPVHGTRLAPHWDVLSELSSRISLAKLKNEDIDRQSLASSGLDTAKLSRDGTWLTRMQLELAQARLRVADTAGALDPLVIAVASRNPSPELMARISAARALAALELG